MSKNNPGDRTGWFWIRVNDCSGGIFSGTLQNMYQQEPIPFHGLDHFLQLAQKTMDEADFPQASCRRRRFLDQSMNVSQEGKHHPSSDGRPDTALHQMQPGKFATFEIKVTLRQSASWQGAASLLSNGKRKQIFFRSSMELILAMREIAEMMSTEQESAILEKMIFDSPPSDFEPRRRSAKCYYKRNIMPLS